jgi:aldehyde:ferredoxin oxidoreductase
MKKFIGGRGLAGHYLRPYCHLPWDSPEMPLLFFTGPLVDTGSPTSGIMSVMSISPLTGGVGISYTGGGFGTELKRAGWDGIIIIGRSENLCGIRINDGRIEFTDAENLRGKSVSGIFSTLPQNGAAAAAGPAAENGVLFSSIAFTGDYVTGRCGMGLVMHAKGMKFIHISGSGSTDVYNSTELNTAREDILRLVSASPALMGELGISEFGTGAFYDLIHSRRMMPSYNFRKTSFQDAPGLNAWHYKDKYHSIKTGCSGCHILCRKTGKDGKAIPEFEAMSHFTALIGNSNIDLVMEANRICIETGMDTISAASAIACYMEVKNLSFPDINLIQLLNDIACSNGDGMLLKTGSKKTAEALGKPEMSMTVKDLELPAYDPRGAYGISLAYITSTTGGCHTQANPVSFEILRKPAAVDRFTFTGKARIIKLAEDLNAVIDSLTACRFIFFAATIEEYAKVFHAVTGSGLTGQELLMAGERIFYNERLMNRIRGFDSSDDVLPPRFFNESGSSGDGITISPLLKEEFLDARARYYRVRGLDSKGCPVKTKCIELGLEWID